MKCNRDSVEANHERYVKCVESGIKPINCSFKVAFTEEKK